MPARLGMATLPGVNGEIPIEDGHPAINKEWKRVKRHEEKFSSNGPTGDDCEGQHCDAAQAYPDWSMKMPREKSMKKKVS